MTDTQVLAKLTEAHRDKKDASGVSLNDESKRLKEFWKAYDETKGSDEAYAADFNQEKVIAGKKVKEQCQKIMKRSKICQACDSRGKLSTIPDGYFNCWECIEDMRETPY